LVVAAAILGLLMAVVVTDLSSTTVSVVVRAEEQEPGASGAAEDALELMMDRDFSSSIVLTLSKDVPGVAPRSDIEDLSRLLVESYNE